MAALLVLALMLDLAAQRRHSAQQAIRGAGGATAPPRYAHIATYLAEQTPLFGQLLTSTEEWETPASFVEHVTGISTAGWLIGELARLHRLSALPTDPSPDRSLQEPRQTLLLADLLRLPSSMDPLKWLQEGRGEMCARLVLEYLIRQVCPPPDFLLGATQIRPPLHPKIRLRIQGNLWIRMESIVFFEAGFAIRLRAHIYSSEAWHPSRRGGSFFPPRWEGFSRITDNNGHLYLTQLADCQVSNQLWWWHERVTLLCYPGVADAHELFLQSQPTALAIYQIPVLGDELIPLPSHSLGEMRLSLSL